MGGMPQLYVCRRCRAVICWVRAAVQQCRVESPRKCIVYLTSDSNEVSGLASVVRMLDKSLVLGPASRELPNLSKGGTEKLVPGQ